MTKTSKGKDRREHEPYHRGHVREDLIIAAEKILESEGVSAVTLRRLTREIGVTPANFYNHFESLDYLLAAIATSGFRKLNHRMVSIIDRSTDLRNSLKALCREYIYFAADNPQMYRIMFGHLRDFSRFPEFRELRDKAFCVTVELIYGKNRVDPNNVSDLFESLPYAYSTWSMLHGMAQIIIDRQVTFKSGLRQDIGVFVDRASEAFIDGVGALLDKR